MDRSPSVFVSPADYATIEADLSAGDGVSPEGWTNHVAPGTTDLINWSALGCFDTASATSTDDLATVFDLNGPS